MDVSQIEICFRGKRAECCTNAFDAVAEKMIAEKKIRFDRAKDLVEEYSKKA